MMTKRAPSRVGLKALFAKKSPARGGARRRRRGPVGQIVHHLLQRRDCRPEEWPQVRWTTAEVVYDKHGEPFAREAAVRQGIIKYHQNGDDKGNEKENRSIPPIRRCPSTIPHL